VLLAAEGAHEPHGIVFLDFEDVVHSVLPAAFDVALLCERAILAAEPDEAAARASIAALLHAYAEAGGGSIVRPAILPDIMRGLALRSLCTLALIDPAGTDTGEWGKFFHLFEAAATRREVFVLQEITRSGDQ
jgi:Ser/Thr protein kinase RdoA (MazF antagonist)